MKRFTREEAKIINIMQQAYINIYGIEAWESLTNKQKWDVVMHLVNVANKAVDLAQERANELQKN